MTQRQGQSARVATIRDIEVLASLMVDFYAEAEFRLSEEAAKRTFEALLASPALGQVWLLEVGGEAAGFIVLTVSFSMEYGRLRGFVDDFFVAKQFRRRGLGALALQAVRGECTRRGVGALLVETGPTNEDALSVYRRAGFVDTEHVLLKAEIGPALHEAGDAPGFSNLIRAFDGHPTSERAPGRWKEGAEPMASDLRLALVPVLASLVITLLRLTGEFFHLSERWFSTATGGILPSGWTWLFGITWLPFVFGPYFAHALRRATPGAPRGLRVLAVSSLGVAVVLSGFGFLLPRLSLAFPVSLLAVWVVMLAGAALQVLAWPRLCRVLLFYGLGSRAPVAVLMFFAMRGHWGTHYDYVDMPFAQQLPFFERFLWLALIPQLVFWTAFTVILGSLATGLYLVLFERQRPA